jgi:hypothetical protein
MLLTNQQLDKLAAACINFTSHGMLNGTCLSEYMDRKCFLKYIVISSTLMYVLGLQDPGCAKVDNNSRHNKTASADDTRNVSNSFDGDNDDNDDYDGAVDDSTVLAYTELAKVAHEYSIQYLSLLFVSY